MVSLWEGVTELTGNVRFLGKADAEAITKAICDLLTDTFSDTWKAKVIGMAIAGMAMYSGNTLFRSPPRAGLQRLPLSRKSTS